MSEKTLAGRIIRERQTGKKEQTFLFTRLSAAALYFALLFVINKVGT